MSANLFPKPPIRNVVEAARALVGRTSSELFFLRDAIDAFLTDVERCPRSCGAVFAKGEPHVCP